jgi:putative oxidoreductase
MVIFAIQIRSALLFLINRLVPLALVLIGPVIVNILCFHILMSPQGLPLALLIAALWVIVAVGHRKYLSGLFVVKAA